MPAGSGLTRAGGPAGAGGTGGPQPGDTMPAWRVVTAGEPADAMRLEQVPVPAPGPGQVLVEPWSTALNFPDVLLARGTYQERPTLPFTPGVEMCGRVVAVGQGVGRHLVGERVVGTTLLPHGALARYALAPAGDVHVAPTGLDDVTASALHIAYQTAWFALYRRAGLRVTETLLVHAAAGGVGSAAVQLGKAAGAKVIAVVGGPHKAMAARRLGADVVLDRTTTDVVRAVKQATGGKGVDVVFDPVGGTAFTASTKVIAFEGRIVVVGFAGGDMMSAPTNHLLVKNYSVLGLHWGLYRSKDPDLVRRAHQELTSLVDARAVSPLVSDHLPFEQAAVGLTRLAAGQTVGRVTVAPPEG
jgi:NADPH2:quinone reductase